MSNFVINSYNFGSGAFTDEGLKAYWKFDEGSGNIINVSQSAADMGSNADIVMNGGTYAQTGTPSSFGNSVLFDGVNDYGQAGGTGGTAGQWNFLHNTTAEYTKILWFRFQSGGAGEPNFIGDGGFSTSVIGNDCGYFDTNQILDAIYSGTGTVFANATGNNYIPDTTDWHMYAFTFDISLGSNNSEIRRDNANLKQASVTGTAVDTNSSNALSFMINPRAVASYIGLYACEWSVWDRVLSTEDQTALWNDGDGMEIY